MESHELFLIKNVTYTTMFSDPFGRLLFRKHSRWHSTTILRIPDSHHKLKDPEFPINLLIDITIFYLLSLT